MICDHKEVFFLHFRWLALVNNWAFFLSVCEYYAHLECQDFVVSDCKECATYGPQKDLVSITLRRLNQCSR